MQKPIDVRTHFGQGRLMTMKQARRAFARARKAAADAGEPITLTFKPWARKLLRDITDPVGKLARILK